MANKIFGLSHVKKLRYPEWNHLTFKLSKMDYYVYKAELLYTEQSQNHMKNDQAMILIQSLKRCSTHLNN